MKLKRYLRKINRGVLLALLLILALVIQLLVSYTKLSKHEEEIEPFLEEYLNAYAQQSLTLPEDQVIDENVQYDTAYVEEMRRKNAAYQERLYNTLKDDWVFFDENDNMNSAAVTNGVTLKEFAATSHYIYKTGFLSARSISSLNVEDVKFESNNLALVSFSYTDAFTYTGSISVDDVSGSGGSDLDEVTYNENGEMTTSEKKQSSKALTESQTNYLYAYLQYTDDGWKLVSF